MFHHPFPSRRRWGAATLAAAALGVPLLAATGSSPATGAEPTNPTIDLSAPSNVTVTSYGGDIYDDLGFRLEVTGAPLEIWTQRAPDYQSVPTAVAKLPLGDVTLPEQKRVGELNRFIRIRVVDRNDPDAAPIVRRRSVCLSDSSRISPDSDFKNTYPGTCFYNPFALGAVQGVPAGWAANVLGYESRLPLKPGEYDVKVMITDPYADALGLTNAERSASTVLTVQSSDDCRGCRDERRSNPRLSPNRTEPDPDGGITSIDELPPGTPTPDLRSLPAFGIQINRKGTQLQFAANVWNGGNTPLVVDGFRRDGEDVMDAYQYFLDANGDQVAYQQVGTMVWHPAPSHNHWHFKDFATYELLNADQTRAVRSGKESFCLANTDAVDLTVENADWEGYEEDLGSVCGGHELRSIREVLSAGWGDTYTQYRAGQSFPIKNLADGVYYVRVLANPDGTLIETDTTNNESLRKVRIYTNRHGERRVKVAPVGIITDERWGYFRSR